MTQALPDSSVCAPDCQNCRLRSREAFMPVTLDELAFIRSFRKSTSAVPAGGTIIHEQKPNGKLFTLYAGWAFRYKTLHDGRRQILNFMLPGDLVGLQQQFADGAMHGVEAVTDVQLCIFSRDGLWDLYRAHPGLGYDITWLAARGEGRVDDNLVTTGRRNAAERVAMQLMHLFRRMDRLGLAAEGWVDFPINQQHIADALGLHTIEAGRLRLLNPKALVRLADYYDAPLRKAPLL